MTDTKADTAPVASEALGEGDKPKAVSPVHGLVNKFAKEAMTRGRSLSDYLDRVNLAHAEVIAHVAKIEAERDAALASANMSRATYDPMAATFLKAENERLVKERDALRSEVEKLREALSWYGEQARLARLIHKEGDAGRHAIHDDGGSRARAALDKINEKDTAS